MSEVKQFLDVAGLEHFWALCTSTFRKNSTITPVDKGGTGSTTAAGALSNLGAVPNTRAINGKALSSNITLSAADVGALSANPAQIEFKPGTSSNNGGFIDFHFNGSTSDYTSRIIETSSGVLGINEHAYVKLGTVTGGIWNGSAIPVANGGTGATDAPNARKNLLITSLKTTDVATTALVQGIQASELPSTANGTQDPQGGILLTAATSNNRGVQIANGYAANSLKWRFIHSNQTSDAGTAGYSPWYTIYHSGNVTNASGVSF